MTLEEKEKLIYETYKKRSKWWSYKCDVFVFNTPNKELTLSDRVWTCECGKTLNRDENAAINIMNAGLNMV